VEGAIRTNIRNDFEIGTILGLGNFGTVREAVAIHGNGKRFAIKQIEKKKIGPNLQLLRNEVEVL
jgi:serine/threonine protein kinase